MTGKFLYISALLTVVILTTIPYVFYGQEKNPKMQPPAGEQPSYLYNYDGRHRNILKFGIGSYPKPTDFESASVFFSGDGSDYYYIKEDRFLHGWGLPDTSYDGRLSNSSVVANSFKIPNLSKINSVALDSLTVYDFVSDYSFGMEPIKEFEFNNCFISSMRVGSDSLSVEISGSYAKNIRCEYSVITYFIIGRYIDTLDLYNCKITKLPFIHLAEKPKVIKLTSCDFTFPEPIWDLDNIWKGKDDNKCLLNLNGVNVSRLKFNYDEYILDTTGMSFEQLQSLYNNLKDQYTKLGMTESFKLADIDLTKLNNYHKGGLYKVVDAINRWWWDYGYSKGKIVGNSILLFLLFLIINSCIGLSRLLVHGYTLPAFTEIPNHIKRYRSMWKRSWYRFWYTFLFTCLVFWGINLDKRELRLKNLGYIFYIILQYLVGIVCLAYLAAFILSK
jgi:hypothetical protein